MRDFQHRQSFLSTWLSTCLVACALASCGGDGARNFGGQSTGGQGAGARDGGVADTSSTGGTIGSGGAIASSGGASGTGGLPGSGGSASGGNTVSTGGMHGTGGMPGSGGTGGATNATCDGLAMDYQKEMPHAKSCTIGIGLSQCQTAIANTLGCAGCLTYVQDPSNLNELKRKWTANNCDTNIRICPAVACVQPQPGNCAIAGAVGNPQCQDRPLQ